MARIDSEKSESYLTYLASSILIVILVIVAVSLLSQHNRNANSRKAAFVRANRIALYSNIESLEHLRQQTLSEMLQSATNDTNVNAALVKLLRESHVYSPVRIRNISGSDMFVDPWGVPYRFLVSTNMPRTNLFGREIETRVLIESGNITSR